MSTPMSTNEQSDAFIAGLLPKIKHRTGMYGFECYSFADVAAAVRAALASQQPAAVSVPLPLSTIKEVAGSVFDDENFELTGEIVEFAQAIALLASSPAQPQQGEPVGYMSAEQVPLIGDPDGDGGVYIPLRKTPAGKLTLALYAAQPPAPPAQTLRGVLKRAAPEMNFGPYDEDDDISNLMGDDK